MSCYFKSACGEDVLLCWMHALGCKDVFCKIAWGVFELMKIFIGAWGFSNFIVICICAKMFLECLEILFCAWMLDNLLVWSDSGGKSPHFFRDANF